MRTLIADRAPGRASSYTGRHNTRWYRDGGRAEPLPVRRARARRGVHRPRAGDRRAPRRHRERAGRGRLRAAALRQDVARVAGAAAGRRCGRAGRARQPDDDADEGEARGEAREDDPRRRRLGRLPGPRAGTGRLSGTPGLADGHDRPRRRLRVLRLFPAARAPTTFMQRSSGCSSSRASLPPSAAAGSPSSSTSSRRSSTSTPASRSSCARSSRSSRRWHTCTSARGAT